jgi:hypothetical protein
MGIKGHKSRFKVFEKRVLTRISGLKRDAVIRGWRKQLNEELDCVNFSLNIVT